MGNTESEIELIIKEATEKARAAGFAEGWLAGYIDRELEVQHLLEKEKANVGTGKSEYLA